MFALLSFMCFGRRLEDEAVREIEAVQRELFANYIGFCPALTTRVLFRRRWRKVLDIRRRQEQLFLPLIRARRDRRNGSNGDGDVAGYCYVDTLLAHRLPQEEEEEGGEQRGLTEGEMVSLCTEFLTASVDTTVTALQWVMANLVLYPEIQSKLHHEINTAMTISHNTNHDDDDDRQAMVVSEEDLERMPYLKAVVLEGLRRHPPAHFLLSHAVSEEEDATPASLDGYRIPAATSVNFSVADVGMDEEIWSRPEEFRPERFMGGGEGDRVDLTGSGRPEVMKMMPFGVGRRICPGMALALLHLEFFVANMVWGFEWTPAPGHGVDLAERPEFTVTMERPLRALVKPRKRMSRQNARPDSSLQSLMSECAPNDLTRRKISRADHTSI